MLKVVLVISVFLFAQFTGVASALTYALIYTTDVDANLKTDFAPGDLVYVRGENFNPSSTIYVDITRPDATVESGTATSDGSGFFVYVYDLDGIVGEYLVEAYDDYENYDDITFTDTSGAIWTTRNDCGNSTQDVNEFYFGEKVYINGAGFGNGTYSWDITGQPGSCDPSTAVASGNFYVGSSGNFCFHAYTVQLDDCGVYQTKFGVKGDNYHVDQLCPNSACDSQELVTLDRTPDYAKVDSGANESYKVAVKSDGQYFYVDVSSTTRYLYMTWYLPDYTPEDAAVFDAMLYFTYYESSGQIQAIEYWDGSAWQDSGCGPYSGASSWSDETCDLNSYDLINNDKVQLRMVLVKDGTCHVGIDYAKLTMEYTLCPDDCYECEIDADCNNGLYCDGAEYCDYNHVCQPGTPPSCDDGVSCTADSCNEETDSCDSVPDDGNCPSDTECADHYCDAELGCQVNNAQESTPCEADGQFCTVDHCDGQGSCVYWKNYDCSGLDEVCKVGVCNEDIDQCEQDPLPWSTPCDNGQYCDGDDHCDGYGDCVGMGTPIDCSGLDGDCQAGVCDEGQDSCVPDYTEYPWSTPCEADQDICTVDHCLGNGTCAYYMDNNIPECQPGPECGNGILEEGETCEINSPCPYGCSDDSYYIESCNEVTCQCELTYLEDCYYYDEYCSVDEIYYEQGYCDQSYGCDFYGGYIDSCDGDYEYCDFNERWQYDEWCVDGGEFAYCSSDDDMIENCDFYNIDDCDGTWWIHQTGTCMDDQGSTICALASSTGDCDDGLWCNGPETCEGSGICVPGAPIDCSDINTQCQSGICDEYTDTCVPDYTKYPESTWCETDADPCTIQHCNGQGLCETYDWDYEEPGCEIYDLGDAPDSTNSWGVPMTAYPGPVVANYPTVHIAGSPPYGPCHNVWFLVLGQEISLENEADILPDQDVLNNIDPVFDIPDQDSISLPYGMDDGLKYVPINMTHNTIVMPHCQATYLPVEITITGGPFTENWNAYLNIWIDYNQDGDWQDTMNCVVAGAPEWVVQNQVVASLFAGGSGPGTFVVNTSMFLGYVNNPDTPVWMRVQVTPVPVQYSDGSGPQACYEDGETEDYSVFLEEPEVPCDIYDIPADCVEAGCAWCPQCKDDACTSKVNQWLTGTCVESGTSCGYHCEVPYCGAECDSHDDCDCPEDYCDDVDHDGSMDDYVNYPDYGTCRLSYDCACDTGTGLDQPCYPAVEYNSEQCQPGPEPQHCSDLAVHVENDTVDPAKYLHYYNITWYSVDCDTKDDWYDNGTTIWVDDGPCGDKEQKWQEYHDYICVNADCNYQSTDYRLVDTGVKDYNDPDGPVVSDIVFVPNPAGGQDCIANITATITEDCTTINEAYYWFDSMCSGEGRPIYPADDSSFDDDNYVEYVQAIDVDLDNPYLNDGGHVLWMRSKNSNGTWGPCEGVAIEIDRFPPNTINQTITNPKWIDINNYYWMCADDGDLRAWICDIFAQSTICEAEYVVDSDAILPGYGYPMDPVDGMWGDFTCEEVNGTVVNTDFAEGLHWLKVRAHDCACNWGKVVNLPKLWFVLDRTPPQINKTIGTPHLANDYDYITNETEITLECHDIDPGDGWYSDDVTIHYRYRYKVDFGDAWGPWSGWFDVNDNIETFKFNEDSIHELEYYCTDKCGHYDQIYSEIDIVDSKPPVTEKVVSDPKIAGTGDIDWFITSDTVIELTCTDQEPHPVNDVTLYWDLYWSQDCENPTWTHIDGGSTEGYKMIDDLNDSCHKLVYWCEDALGNEEAKHIEIDAVDNTPPEQIKVIGQPNIPVVGADFDYWVRDHVTEITLDCDDSWNGTVYHPVDSETMCYAISFDEEPWLTDEYCEDFGGEYIAGDIGWCCVDSSDLPYTFTFQEDSWHDLAFVCVDALGNEGQLDVEFFRVDSVPPEISKGIEGPWYGDCLPQDEFDICYIDGVTNITLNAWDPDPTENGCNVGGVECKWGYYLDDNYGTFYGWYTDFPIHFPEETKHELWIYCEDELGNWMEDVEIFYVDKTPPTTTKTYGTPLVEEPTGGYPKWITSDTEITLTVEDTGPHKSGIAETNYRVTLVDDDYCYDPEACYFDAEGEGSWSTYSGPFTIDEDSCHLIEYYSVDNVEKTETTKKQCVFVDNTPPENIKMVGEPNTPCWESGIFFEDFEGDVLGWTHGMLPDPYQTYTTSDWWELRTTAYGTDNYDFGTTVYGTTNNGEHGGYEHSYLMSPQISLPNAMQIDLIFDSYTANEGGCPEWYDVEWVEISTDNETWATLNDCGDPEELHYDSDMQWRTFTFDISAYAGQDVYIRFRYNTGDNCCGQDNQEGWYIDNVGIVTPDCYWVRDHVTEITIDCDDSWYGEYTHPVDQEMMCYKVSYDYVEIEPEVYDWGYITEDYCDEFGGDMYEGWCCVDVSGEADYTFTFQEDSMHDLEFICIDGLKNMNNLDLEYFKVDSVAPETTKTFGGAYYEKDGAEYIDTASWIILESVDGGEVCASGVDKIWYKNILAESGYYGDLGEEACQNPDVYCTVPQEFEYCQYCEGGEYPYECMEDQQKWCTKYWEIEQYDSWHDCVEQNAWYNCCGGWDWQLYSEPIYKDEESCHMLYYFSVDELGNVEDIQVNCFYVDKQAPETTKTYGTPYYTAEGAEWITSNTSVTLTAIDPEPHPSGVDYTKYRVTLVDDDYCWSEELCYFDAEGEGSWLDYTGSFTIGDDSCHLIEYYSVDNVEKTETTKKQCVFVDNSEPYIEKSVGQPYHKCTADELIAYGSPDYGCVYVNSSTVITLNCYDVMPHPVNDVTLYYRNYLLGETAPAYTAVPGGYTEIQKTPDSEHVLEFYCVDALGNSYGTADDPYVEIDIVDNLPPVSVKTLGDPKHECTLDEMAMYYPDMDDPTDGCYFITQDTPIEINCSDQQPHPVDHVGIYYRDYLVGDDVPGWTYVDGDYAKILKGEDSAHVLEWYCVDALGNAEQMHVEYDIVDSVPPEGIKVIGDPKIPCEPVLDGPCVNGCLAQILPEPGDCYWVRDHVTEITLDCDDSWGGEVPHPVDHEIMCYKVSFDLDINGDQIPDDEGWSYLTEDYCDEFGGTLYDDWCCVDVSGETEYKFTFQEDSMHDLEYFCVDALENINQVDIEYFHVDSVAPTTTKSFGGAYYEDDGVEWIDTASWITFNATDGGDICHVGVDKTWYMNVIDLTEQSCWEPELYCEPVTAIPSPYDDPETAACIDYSQEWCKEYWEMDWDSWYDCVEDWAYYECGVDPLWKLYDGDPVYKPEESCHILTYFSVDHLGNVEALNANCFFVDKQAPETEKTYGEPYFEGWDPGCYDWCEDECDSDPGCMDYCLYYECSWAEWIASSTPITLTAIDPEPHPSGVDYTKYRVTLIDDYYCWDYYYCQEYAQGEGSWLDYTGSFTIGDDSCHLIEYYSVDNVEKTETTKKQCVFVDNKAPEGTKTIGDPKIPCGPEDEGGFGIIFFENFEGDDGGFTHSGTYDEWERGTPIQDQCGFGCYSGEKCWVTDLDSYYNQMTDGQLKRTIDLTSVSGTITLEWYQAQIMDYPNYLIAEAKVGPIGGPYTVLWDNTYPNADLGCNYWTLMQYDISGYAGQVIELVFDLHYGSGYSGQIQADGWFIDDVKVTGEMQCDYWVRDHVTEITLDCTDPDPHPVGYETMCYKISYDYVEIEPDVYDWGYITMDYCEEFGGFITLDGWCCADVSGEKEYKFTFQEDSVHDLEYYCTDALGNMNEIDVEYFKVDSTPPNSVKTIGDPKWWDPELELWWVTTDTLFTLTAIDEAEPCDIGVAGFWVTLEWDSDCSGDVDTVLFNDSIPTPYQYNFTFEEECLHKITWYAVDLLGNEEEPKVQYHKVDDTPPHVLILKPVDGWYSDGEDIAVVALAEDIANPHNEDYGYCPECAVGIEDGRQCDAFLIDLLPSPKIVPLDSENLLYNAEAHECQGYATIPDPSYIPDGIAIFGLSVSDNLGNEGSSIWEIMHIIQAQCGGEFNEYFEYFDGSMFCFLDVVQDLILIWNLPKIGIDNNPPEVTIMSPEEGTTVGQEALWIDAEVFDSHDGEVTSTIGSGTPCYVTLGNVGLGVIPYYASEDACSGWLPVTDAIPDGYKDLEVCIFDVAGNEGCDAVEVYVNISMGISAYVEIIYPEDQGTVSGIENVQLEALSPEGITEAWFTVQKDGEFHIDEVNMIYDGPYWEGDYNFGEYTDGATLLLKGYARDTTGMVGMTPYWTTVYVESNVLFDTWLIYGWNKVTIPPIPLDSTDPEDVFDSLNGNYNSIWWWDGDEWLWYDPLDPFPELTEIQTGEDYWIFMEQGDRFFYEEVEE